MKSIQVSLHRCFSGDGSGIFTASFGCIEIIQMLPLLTAVTVHFVLLVVIISSINGNSEAQPRSTEWGWIVTKVAPEWHQPAKLFRFVFSKY